MMKLFNSSVKLILLFLVVASVLAKTKGSIKLAHEGSALKRMLFPRQRASSLLQSSQMAIRQDDKRTEEKERFKEWQKDGHQWHTEQRRECKCEWLYREGKM